MAKNRLSLKSSSKLKVRKDLFRNLDSGVHDSSKIVEDSIESPLDLIWGESDSYSFSQPVSNSILLSPALKKYPNRFSTSPSSKKSAETPKKKISTPQKLSKYSPFRKKVYNPNPKDSIKKFFPVKERKTCQDESSQSPTSSFGIDRLSDQPGPSDIAHHVKSERNFEETSCPTNVSENDTVGDHSNTTLAITIQDNTSMLHTPTVTPVKSNPSTPQSAKKNLSPTSKITGKSDVYGSFLLRVLFEIAYNDSDPNSMKLFSEEEYKHINAFNQLDQPSQRLYGRLLNRKHDWIRVATMKYGDVHLQLMLLEQNGFITSYYGDESVETLLYLLTVPELKKLSKLYKLSESANKPELISKLISRVKQPSIASFFTKKNSGISDNENNIRAKIYDSLGLAVKIVSGPQKTFSRSLLFFSYPHFRGLERDRFSDQLALVSQFNNLTFPSYDVSRTQVFTSRDSFLAYETALIACSSLSEAKEVKNWELALQRLRAIVEKLETLLSSEDVRAELEAMPDFLRKFTACSCYVRAVGGSVDVFKKWELALCDAEACLELLLSQRLISRHRRGQWFEQLALLYQHNFKDNVKATETVLRGLRDEYIDVVSRHLLCARAATLEARKTNGLKDYLKDTLAKQRSLVEALEPPPSITISQQVLDNSRPGLKQVYVQDSEDGKMLSSVEEVAREHFKQQGYTHGGHDEGGIIKSLIFACFWDEIYGDSILEGHGMFHSAFQTVPLDWNSETFFGRRREKFKKKLQDLAEGGVEAVITTFQDCFMKNVTKESVVNWKYLEHYDVIESLIRCLDIDMFLNLARLLLKEHRIFSAGFPDLTLWDPNERKCLFVEVKSPNDQLSMKQRVWLHNLNKMGANALVCHVQSVGCKSQKRKASSTDD